MREFVAVLLIGVIASCPVLCGAEETDHAPHTHGSSRSHDGPPGPSHCPTESDNCVCQGAVVQNADAHALDRDGLSLPTPLVAILHTPPHPLAHLTWDGSPTGLAGWGGSLTVRALLQNFRC